MLRFLFDENVSRTLGQVAVEENCDVLFVVDILTGAPDDEVIARATEERRILVTEDLGFGRLVFGFGTQALGVVLIRIAPWKKDVRSERFRWLIRRQAGRLEKSFTILGESSLRVRPIS